MGHGLIPQFPSIAEKKQGTFLHQASFLQDIKIFTVYIWTDQWKWGILIILPSCSCLKFSARMFSENYFKLILEVVEAEISLFCCIITIFVYNYVNKCSGWGLMKKNIYISLFFQLTPMVVTHHSTGRNQYFYFILFNFISVVYPKKLMNGRK